MRGGHRIGAGRPSGAADRRPRAKSGPRTAPRRQVAISAWLVDLLSADAAYRGVSVREFLEQIVKRHYDLDPKSDAFIIS